MKVTLQATGMEAVRRELQGFSERRLNAAMATALTRTVNEIKAAEQREMRDVFDRPTRWTLGSLYASGATAGRLSAEVGIKGSDQGSRSATKWLRWQVDGGLRTLTAFERFLVAAGAMPDGMRAVPGKAAPLDAYGNVRFGVLGQILSQLRVEIQAGVTRTRSRIARDERSLARTGSLRGISAQQKSAIRNARKRVNAERKSLRKSGGRYVALPYGAHRGKLPPGIYLNEGRDFGARLGYGYSGRMRPVLIFVSKAYYEPERFDFYYVAKRGAARLPEHLLTALQLSASRKPGLEVR